MCLYADYKESQKETKARLEKFRSSLAEGTKKDIDAKVRDTGKDEKAGTEHNKKDGFKITSDASLKRIKAAQVRRENAINKRHPEIAGQVKNAKRLKSFDIKTSQKATKRHPRGTVSFALTGIL